MSKHGLHQELLDTSLQLIQLGLNRGSSGNISVRDGSDFLITPSATPISEMVLESMVRMDFAGNVLEGGKPSSEWRFHRDILADRPEIGAVIHTHSIFATTIACMRRDVPAVHYMIALADSDFIPCSPYSIFGEQELSDNALIALQGRKACLLGNHGMIALGTNLADALAVAIEVEFVCEIFLRTLQAGGPHILTSQQMHDVKEQFVEYKKRS